MKRLIAAFRRPRNYVGGLITATVFTPVFHQSWDWWWVNVLISYASWSVSEVWFNYDRKRS